MDGTYGTYVGDECFDIHDYDDDTDDDTGDDTDELMTILMMILMTILMMVGAGTEDRSQTLFERLPQKKIRGPFWKYSGHYCPFNP